MTDKKTPDTSHHSDHDIGDQEMVDQLSASQPGIIAWLRTVSMPVLLGLIITASISYGIYYLVVRYGLQWLY